MRIDDNGDRDADYSLLDLGDFFDGVFEDDFNDFFFKDPVTGRFEVVSHYYGANRSLVPVPGKREIFIHFFTFLIFFKINYFLVGASVLKVLNFTGFIFLKVHFDFNFYLVRGELFCFGILSFV